MEKNRNRNRNNIILSEVTKKNEKEENVCRVVEGVERCSAVVERSTLGTSLWP